MSIQLLFEEPSIVGYIDRISMAISGWVFATEAIQEVGIILSNAESVVGQYGRLRPDVAKHFSESPNATSSGFMIPCKNVHIAKHIRCRVYVVIDGKKFESNEINLQPSLGDREKELLDGIDLTRKGLEISPLHNPILLKSLYNIKTCDYYTTEELKQKYANRNDIDISCIDDVDFALKGEPISKVIDEQFDFIICSHVIEHIPNIVTFLNELSSLLFLNGYIVLVIPDKRKTFDYFRPITSCGSVLQAYYEKRTNHTIGEFYDHVSFAIQMNNKISWIENTDISKIEFINHIDATKDILSIYDVNSYIDVHGNIFTPSSFELIFYEMKKLGIIDSMLDIQSIKQSQYHNEFFVRLIKSSNQSTYNSNIKMELLKKIKKELQD